MLNLVLRVDAYRNIILYEWWFALTMDAIKHILWQYAFHTIVFILLKLRGLQIWYKLISITYNHNNTFSAWILSIWVQKTCPKPSYSGKNLIDAISKVKNQELSIRKASAQFGIPYGTLGDKVRGRRPLNWKTKGKFSI